MAILASDVLVVGAGLAGFTAAVRASEQGVKVLLIDKSAGELGDGNILMASGSLRAGGKNPRTDPDELYDFVMSEGVAYPDLVRAWSQTCGRAIDWLMASGVKVSESAPVESGWISPVRFRSRRFTKKTSARARSASSKNDLTGSAGAT
jgi:succinate dehydrogenase/fumarate reductase flavoprotein subunit